ncbi:MAG: AAA family ATPase [Myxococcota bacterium]
MSLDELFLLPGPPGWTVDWRGLDERYEWIRAMRGVPQDPVWHAEGDVWIHSMLVCEALAASEGFRKLDKRRRRVCWLGALFHDIAKPYSTQEEEGRIRSRYHSPRGALDARRILFRAGLDRASREEVAGIVRHHQLPFHALGEESGERRTSAASMRCRIADLVLVAEADMRGRSCPDQSEKLEQLEMFSEFADELQCLNGPRPFPSDHTRFLYFRGKRPPAPEAFDDSRSTVRLLSGLPGAGKSSWRRTNHPDLPVVCLDDLRRELDVDPTDNQGRVRQAAKERARTFLRTHQDFVWDATNLDADRRRKLVDLFVDYRARVQIVSVETSYPTLLRDNRARPSPVPDAAIEGMLRRWTAPDATEAHRVEIFDR